ncbi:MAG: SusC/RagA family TonB-linked outer membrane protein [Candidatus Dadabacteria bacterium]
MRRIIQLALLNLGLLLLSFSVLAQERTVSGTVASEEDGTPLVGVTVALKGTSNAVVTDGQGRFSIAVQPGQSLLFSHVGYTTLEHVIRDRSNITIRLAPAKSNTLEDVVVVGYGTQKRANLTGAVSTVDVKKTLQSRPLTDLGRGLQGVVPGLTITTPSGDIGTNPAIRLRGLSGSLNGPGAQPLILVDNVELPDLRMINPDDVESISVLKDAASTSIYGTRAAWGVILITTKNGKKGTEGSKISYTNNFSWSRPIQMPRVAPGPEGGEMALLAYKRNNPNTTYFGAVGLYLDDQAIQRMRDWQTQYGGQNLGPEMELGRDFEIRSNRLYFYRTFDPLDLYLRDYSPQQNHNLTISGSSPKTGYSIGLGYLGQKGVLKVNPDEFERFNVNLGVTSSVTNWLDARTKIILAKATRLRPYYFSSETYDPWYYLTRWQAYYPYGTYQGKPFRSALTEVQQAKMTPQENTIARMQLGGTFKLLPGLTVDADYTYGINNGHEHQTGGSVSAWDFWSGGGSLVYGPYTSATYDRAIYNSDWNERNTVKAYATYLKDVGNHDFKLTAGTDVELYQYWSQSTERRSLLNPDMGEPRLATGDQYASNTRGHWATLGYFGRINYAFKDKYLLELNGRYDGSSSFPLNKQWAFFPSFSVGYKLSDEQFMDFTKPILSSLKLRGSWGSIGNQAVGGNRFLSVMSSSASNWVIGTNNMLTVGTPGLVSPDLTWERVTTLDFGADARLFKNKVGLTFDWYNRTTSDMITAGITVPSSLGTGAPVRNYGELQTKGWEFTADWNHTFANGLNFNITGVLSDFQETISKFAANTTKLISSNYEGRKLGEIWGYVTDRFFTKDDFETDANGNLILVGGKYVMKKGVATQTRWETSTFFYGPGDIKYQDLNGDEKIDIGTNTVTDPGDQKIIGNSTPRYQYGIRLGAAYKGFDINMFFQGVGKRDYWANGPVFIPGFRIGEAWYAHQLDYWTESNPNAFYPRPTDQLQSNATRNFLPQTKYMLNLAYTRLKNLNFGYTLPTSLTQKIKLKSTRLYVSGENLFTIDNVSIPIDPEIDYTSAGLNDGATYGRVYPYRKVYSFGIQVTL